MRAFAAAVSFSVTTLAMAIRVTAAAGSAAVLATVAASDALARHLGSRRGVAALVLFGFGVVLLATLLPTGAALDGNASSGVCDVSRVGLAPIGDLTKVNWTTLNVLLFVPLGIAIGLLPRTRASAIVVVAAVSLTFAVETVQLLLPVLGRHCESADMVDNLMGLALGLVVGMLVRPIVERI